MCSVIFKVTMSFYLTLLLHDDIFIRNCLKIVMKWDYSQTGQAKWIKIEVGVRVYMLLNIDIWNLTKFVALLYTD